MPLITPPSFVSTYLNNNGYDFQPNLLIIAENYPEPTLARYFYSPILPNFKNRLIPSFSKEVFRNFGVNGNNERTMMNDFLNGVGIGTGRRLLIDALPDGVSPLIHRPISPNRLNDLITDVINIDPNYILIVHNKNKELAEGFLKSTRFTHLIPRLLINPFAKKHSNVFPFLSAPADPNNFTRALNEVRKRGIPI